jgi:hypothetical protein
VSNAEGICSGLWPAAALMARQQEILYTYWANSQGERVSPTTPEARRVHRNSMKCYACQREGKNLITADRRPRADSHAAERCIF